MPEVYTAHVTVWNKQKQCQEQDQMHLILPSEVLHNVIKVGEEDRWLNMDDKPDLSAVTSEFCERMQIIDPANVLALGVCGDAAPFGRKNSLTLLLFHVLSGENHQRFWCAAYTKRKMCQCGWEGEMRTLVAELAVCSELK